MVLLASLLLASSQGGSCFELLEDRRPGEPVALADVREAPCPEKGGASALRYDPAMGVNVATAALRAGDVIAKARLDAGPAIRQGQRLLLASRTGSVTIERPVTAVQSARPSDGKIFVRTDDGEVFAAPIKAEGADE